MPTRLVAVAVIAGFIGTVAGTLLQEGFDTVAADMPSVPCLVGLG